MKSPYQRKILNDNLWKHDWMRPKYTLELNYLMHAQLRCSQLMWLFDENIGTAETLKSALLFNGQLQHWFSHTRIPTSEFSDCMFCNSFISLNNKPTRITPKSATIDESLFTNNFSDNRYVRGILTSDISDHCPIYHIARSEEISRGNLRADKVNQRSKLLIY